MSYEFLSQAISRGLALVLDQVWFKAAGLTITTFFPTSATQLQWVILYALFLTVTIYFVQIILKRIMSGFSTGNEDKIQLELSQRLMLLLDEDENDTSTAVTTQRTRRR